LLINQIKNIRLDSIDDTILQNYYLEGTIMKKTVILLFILFSFALGNAVGMVKSITGKVELKRNKSILLLSVGKSIEAGDILMTKRKSSIGIIFDDGSVLALGENSIFAINKFIVQPDKNRYDVDLNMTIGKASFTSGKVGKLAPESVKFHVPEGVIGIRGTKFLVEID